MAVNPEWRDGIDALRALTRAGGKRTRPTFCYLDWRAFGGGRHPGIVVAAAALELRPTSPGGTATRASASAKRNDCGTS